MWDETSAYAQTNNRVESAYTGSGLSTATDEILQVSIAPSGFFPSEMKRV